jgi:AraC-like DNA-binding protein
MVVRNELEKLHLSPEEVQLGEVTLQNAPDSETLTKLSKQLNNLGFELIDDQKSKLIDKIKTLIIDLIHGGSSRLAVNYSTYLSQQTGKDYTYISNLFSEVEGKTIEQYIIHQKTERAKELIVYGEKSISQIAHELGYSSVSHLSNQFKKVTGLSPSHFKAVGENKRKSLDKV